MNIWDILLTLLLAAALIGAFRSARRQRKQGGCCGDCSQCAKHCNH